MLHVLALAAGLIGPSVVASQPRCNDIAIVQMRDRLRADERSAPAADALDARFTELQGVLARAQDESLVLQSVCSEGDFRPLAAKLLATRAWALALESDISKEEYGTQCPAAAIPVTRGFIAEAWLDVADAERDEPTLPEAKTAEAKVRARAAGVQLTLPSAEEASSYWVTGIQSAGRDAAKGCGR